MEKDLYLDGEGYVVTPDSELVENEVDTLSTDEDVVGVDEVEEQVVEAPQEELEVLDEEVNNVAEEVVEDVATMEEASQPDVVEVETDEEVKVEE